MHPPASQFQQRNPYGIFGNKVTASASAFNMPVTMANSRYAMHAQSLSLNASRAQSVIGSAYHSRNHSSAANIKHSRSISSLPSSSNSSDPVRAWVGTQQRIFSASALGLVVDREAGFKEVDTIFGPRPMRREEMDLSRRLERKLMEVRRRLDAQSAGSGSESGSGSSYSLGEIERGLSMSPIVERGEERRDV